MRRPCCHSAEAQRRHIKRTERFDLLEPYRQARICREHIEEVGDEAVLLFRPAMMRDVNAANLWPKARAV
jgi:ribonuclease J